MKRILLCVLAGMLVAMPISAKKEKKQEVDSLGNKIKTGWNFGILPSVAYDADYGFQGGVLTNIYDYGDGSQYPEYKHSIYIEAAYTTKHHGIFRVNYDSKYLIKNHRLTLDATYLPDAMCDFYGYNGYQSVYNSNWHQWKKDPTKMDVANYQSRVYYKYKRDLIRVAGDIEGTIYKDLKWNAGVGVLGYLVDECDIEMLNGKKHKYEVDPATGQKTDWKSLDPNVRGLYQKYQDWGLINKDEANGGWHPYVRVGLSYDTRDKRQGPTKGIYTDAFFTYNAAFNAAYGQQASAGYNNLQFNFTWRHYVPVYKDRITFAYRLGTQNRIAGKSPFYTNSYLNTQFIQRVLYEGLGGGNSLRGIMANRILADGFAYANVEFRFRVVNFDIKRQHFFVGLNPFFDLGVITQPYELGVDETTLKNRINTDADVLAHNATVTDPADAWSADDFFSFDKKDIYRPHMAAGVGLKIGMNENFVLSADWSMPVNEKYYMQQDNSKYGNFYIKMGYLF